MNEQEAEQFSNELLSRLKSATPEHLGALFEAGGIVWHNHDRIEMDAQDDCDEIVGFREMVDDLDFQFVESAGLADGFMLRFIISGTTRADGKAIAGHNCLTAKVQNGKITRIDEYVDPNLFSTFTA